MENKKVVGIIPSRYGSSRLPGKPLLDILGKPMVWWAYQQAKTAKKIDEIYVATDDVRISDICEKYNIPVIMTKSTHIEAANRLQEVSEKVEADFYIQINGDEPLINAELITMAVPDVIPLNIEFGTNIITKMTNPVEVIDPSNIKVVYNENLEMVYMSRTAIPYPYKTLNFDYYKHVGIIGYNKKMLDFYVKNPPGKFESIEGIATLRFIDYNKKLQCIIAKNAENLSVDTQKDFEKVKLIIKDKIKGNEFSQEFLSLLNGEIN